MYDACACAAQSDLNEGILETGERESLIENKICLSTQAGQRYESLSHRRLTLYLDYMGIYFVHKCLMIVIYANRGRYDFDKTRYRFVNCDIILCGFSFVSAARLVLCMCWFIKSASEHMSLCLVFIEIWADYSESPEAQ